MAFTVRQADKKNFFHTSQKQIALLFGERAMFDVDNDEAKTTTTITRAESAFK